MRIERKVDFRDLRFQEAFRKYFKEFGVSLLDNTDVFDELRNAQNNEGMEGLLLVEDENIIGFVLYQVEEFTSSSRFFC